MPAFVYRRTSFNAMHGTVNLKGALHTGMLRIGVSIIGMQDHRYSRTVWQVWGRVEVTNHATIGRGCRICVEQEANLLFGSRFTANADTTIICCKRITFGADCLLSWDVQVMDSDLQKISPLNDLKIVLNPDREILFGDHVWVGCRCNILKGSVIPNGCTIASGTIGPVN